MTGLMDLIEHREQSDSSGGRPPSNKYHNIGRVSKLEELGSRRKCRLHSARQNGRIFGSSAILVQVRQPKTRLKLS